MQFHQQLLWQTLNNKLVILKLHLIVLGDVNAETQYALDHFKVDAPELLNDNLADQEVILVDHNEFQQSADSIADAQVKHVVDHHRIANFETAAPIVLPC
ncbi:manganese-dependent inorganic pyrophosphatase [Staphylococcus gallinarum]|uniref:Manganese-dependent inorganic pyrophosphatase n=1 Tax=Staphylococcus gallinarum TaxID=1293 RepID=A0A380FLP1_STAGA|nr:manganese-dependent inorganic pyrophosphatase [Staphylococcus gallinarum]